MTPMEQLDKWVDGESLCPNDQDECCPDFSCCTSTTTHQEVKEAFRVAYLQGDHETMERFCIHFLGGAMSGIASPNNKVHFAGGAVREEN